MSGGSSPAPTPTTTSTVVVPGFGPTQGVSGGSTASAGLYAFLIVAGLAAVSVVIFMAMNRSLRTARANLGGSVLPRREADQIPVAPARGRHRSGPDGRTEAPPAAAVVPAGAASDPGQPETPGGVDRAPSDAADVAGAEPSGVQPRGAQPAAGPEPARSGPVTAPQAMPSGAAQPAPGVPTPARRERDVSPPQAAPWPVSRGRAPGDFDAPGEESAGHAHDEPGQDAGPPAST